MPPLYASGDDDCAALFELFLNTSGFRRDKMITSDPSTSSDGRARPKPPAEDDDKDVPLLLSRTLGLCRGMTLRSLRIRRATGGSIEVTGPILPSAVRDLLYALPYSMAVDKKIALMKLRAYPTTASVIKGEDANEETNDDSRLSTATDKAVGSHYFALSLELHGGVGAHSSGLSEKNTQGGLSITGGPSSRSFNGLPAATFHDSGDVTNPDLDFPVHACQHREVVTMAVWDVLRPSTLMFKTEVSPNHRVT